ncbi:MAG TPA: HDOD domain-containing protein [Polyangiales bacterium]
MRSNPPPANRPRTKQSADYGQGVHTLETDDYALADSQQLQERLLAIFRSANYKPPVLPNIALELTDLTRRSNVSYEDVIKVVEKDPLIVASVLKLAQSPMYGGRLPVQSLKDALNRLGINMLRDMVWQVVVGMRLFRVRGYTASMERLQSHSTFTAYAARIVAARSGIAAEHAFLCGLLHDVGWSGTLIAVAENEKNPPDIKTLFAAIDKMHAEAAETMAKLWHLSAEIVAVVGHHHDLNKEQKPVSVLVPVMCVAEHLADEFGFGVEEAAADGGEHRVDGNLPGRYELAVATLRLESKLDGIRTLCEESADRMRGADPAGAK